MRVPLQFLVSRDSEVADMSTSEKGSSDLANSSDGSSSKASNVDSRPVSATKQIRRRYGSGHKLYRPTDSKPPSVEIVSFMANVKNSLMRMPTLTSKCGLLLAGYLACG